MPTIVKQAANVLDLFEFFASTGQPASLAEIAGHFGWPKSSTFNLITTLAERGFLYEPRPRHGFYPTPRWLSLAQEIAHAEPLPESLQDLLRELARLSAETVWLAGSAGQHAVFLAVIESPQAIRYTAQPGKRVPMHATATGQAILSQMPEPRRAALLRQASYERFGPGTPMSAGEVDRIIEESLARGWFMSASSYSQDLGGVSIPLPLNDRMLSATVAGPLFRMGTRMEETAAQMQAAIKRHFGKDYFDRHLPGLRQLP
ncbi:IclR family transcriptional regulator [Paracoccus methylarcula]|uniref:IclR family transcriptional regulator n=1 Tax=Paracoccus methylarcula TaxID=72022 RepID=A0A3R7SBZ0_9RHOB|nr:IclR family transcriptional regulator [Paracoccus methylarcula]RNF33245.1 IclR family transcriptional regulator [Paracoccus methylarcula]